MRRPEPEWEAGTGTGTVSSVSASHLWATIREEVTLISRAEPMLAGFLYSTVLAHRTIDESLAFILANKLHCKVLPAKLLTQLFHECFTSEELREIRAGFLADLQATYERDPACKKYSQCFLYFKGFHAIQTHRVAHHFWMQGRHALAVMLQSRSSEAFDTDIHPAAKIGKGIMLDHATGLVVGETSVVGDGCSILHSVTLGGSGKTGGDRHPKIGRDVVIGAGALILGNVRVGDGSKVGAGSVVVKEVPPMHVAVGVPAKNMPINKNRHIHPEAPPNKSAPPPPPKAPPLASQWTPGLTFKVGSWLGIRSAEEQRSGPKPVKALP